MLEVLQSSLSSLKSQDFTLRTLWKLSICKLPRGGLAVCRGTPAAAHKAAGGQSAASITHKVVQT